MSDIIDIGSEIIKINNINTIEYINEFILPYVSASTEQMRWKLAMRESLTGKLCDLVTVKCRTPNNKNVEIELSRTSKSNDWLIPTQEKSELSLTWINKSIVHITLPHFENQKIVDKFKSCYTELLTAKKVILDLRNNGGGSGYYAIQIAHYFTNKEIKSGQAHARYNNSSKRAEGNLIKNFKHFLYDEIITDSDKKILLEHINGEAWQACEENLIPNNFKIKNIITAPLVILTNTFTGSAAEDFLVFMDSVDRGTRLVVPQPEVLEHHLSWICRAEESHLSVQLNVHTQMAKNS